MVLHQNKSQAATSIKEAKVTCSQATLDAQTTCSWLILEAKTNFLVVVKKAKTDRGHSVQEAEAACSKAISEAKAWKVSQATIFHEEHGKYMQDIEEQAIREESRSCNDFLSACQIILFNCPPQLKGALATSFHILLGEVLPSSPSSNHRRLLPQKDGQLQLPPSPVPKQSPRPKRQHPLPGIIVRGLLSVFTRNGWYNRFSLKCSVMAHFNTRNSYLVEW